MKKVVLLFLITFMILSCNHKPVLKAKTSHRNGELVAHIRGAIDSLKATTIEIYFQDGIFYLYRDITDRDGNDSMGVWINSPEVGTWVQAGDNMQLIIPEDNQTRLAIPFDPSKPTRYMINGVWNYCCDCNSPSKCCMAVPSGSLGYICTSCPTYGCSACIAVSTDMDGDITGGPEFIFTHPQLTQNNLFKY